LAHWINYFGRDYQAGRPGNAHLTGMKRKTVDVDIRVEPRLVRENRWLGATFQKRAPARLQPERANSGDR
jgi:hypothetical protein